MAIKCDGIYHILSAIVPIYVVVLLGYVSVTWWSLLTSVQCSGIIKFITYLALPMLVFKTTRNTDFYAMDSLFASANTLQRADLLVGQFVWLVFSRSGKLEWVITAFSIATLPNTLVIGIPLFETMYIVFSAPLVQVVVLQGLVWNNVMILLYEYKATSTLLETHFVGYKLCLHQIS